jgi:hypothetical protein
MEGIGHVIVLFSRYELFNYIDFPHKACYSFCLIRYFRYYAVEIRMLLKFCSCGLWHHVVVYWTLAYRRNILLSSSGLKISTPKYGFC